jgi:RhtB (resistance to homoserine/threonine) family protein
MYWPEFLTIAIAHFFAVASPGPDFAIVMRQTLFAGTRSGLWTSLGVGAGIVVHVSYCLLGVALLLSQSAALFNAVKVLAAAFLLLLGVQSIRASFKQPEAGEEPVEAVVLRPSRAFLLGFFTNGLNPKATLFFLALFTVVIDPNTPIQIQLSYGLYLAVATFCWFALLSLVLGMGKVRDFFLSMAVWLERATGAIFIFLAMQLALSGL